LQLKTLVNLNDLKKRKNGTLSEFGIAESFLSEEVLSSPDETENTVSIPLIRVKHQHGWLPKVVELFLKALSEQDVAKSHDNDVFIFDSSSTILKMERRED